ncbi:MAG: hypothetical protein PVI57_07355, partial [Gemmatimonadota bacterium]
MRADRRIVASGVVCVLLLGCGSDDSGPAGPSGGPLTVSQENLTLLWAVSKDQELECGGPAVAGGHVGGEGDMSTLGASTIDISAAWDVGDLIQTAPRYSPQGPAGGPVAPVLGQDRYPYAFRHDAESGACEPGTEATGEVVLTTTGGDEVFGDITGGEAHRLDFILPGDGVESFLEVTVTGGTGQFASATGSFVAHVI